MINFCFFVSSSNCIGKSKFHVFVENLRTYLSLRNNLKRRIQLCNGITKLLHIFELESFPLNLKRIPYFLNSIYQAQTSICYLSLRGRLTYNI